MSEYGGVRTVNPERVTTESVSKMPLPPERADATSGNSKA